MAELREELLDWLQRLGRDEAQRVEAARWAIAAVLAFDPDVDPPVHPRIWELVERVGCADLELETGRWLHSTEDFAGWARGEAGMS